MKIKIGPYPNRAICNLHTNYMNKKYGYVDWPEYKQKGLRVKAQPFAEAWREQAEDIIQSIYNFTINLFLDRRVQKIKIHIDRWDTWSMDHTLAYIVLPMLKQLKETKHGAPYVESADVPKELRMNVHQKVAYKKDGTTDENFFKRWDWVLDEMIYAFDCKANKDDVWMRFDIKTQREAMDAEQERISNGFRLFGKYYENLWD
jgi:hypothetical protein